MADLPPPDLRFRLSTGEALDVRTFKVDERIGSPFSIELSARSPNPDLDLEGFVGELARFDVAGRRSWIGVVRAFEFQQTEPAGLSTYRVELASNLWLLTQRRNHRIFQRMTEPEMAMQLLTEWKIPFEQRIDTSAYSKRDYRVQYAESDFAFLSRMLEDAGISYWFETQGDVSVLVLSDAPHTVEPRPAITHVDDASATPPGDFVTRVSGVRELKPGKYTVRDVDFRMPPSYPLLSSSSAQARPIEGQLESFHYLPGAFLYEGQGDGSPTADDKLTARTSEREAEALARRRLEAKRGEAMTYAFFTSALELQPGVRVGISGHPRSDLGAGRPLLITHTLLQGEATGRWSMQCRGRRSDLPFRPAISTPKPKVAGVEMATVVGPQGDEIHTDEFGRVRVHFPWDRLGRMNDDSSCWVPVSQPWAGTGFGGMNIPRVGQEVVVDFVGGDPDRPLVVGRIYTTSQPVPFKLPENKTQSGWKSNSTNDTGGYNEIMFEDLAGKELLRMQAERDLHRLVKNDEEDTVGHDRTREVKHDEDVTIGNNRTHRVVANERIHIGRNQQTSIGINRATQVGSIDSTIVGDTYVMMVMPPGEGDVPGGGFPLPSGPVGPQRPSHPTTIRATPGELVLDSGEGAKIRLVGNKIVLDAVEIEIKADKVTVEAAGALLMSGPATKIAGTVVAVSGANLLDLKGGMININGPGKPAARLGDGVNSVKILEGTLTVSIGGHSTNELVEVSDENLDERERALFLERSMLADKNHKDFLYKKELEEKRKGNLGTDSTDAQLAEESERADERMKENSERIEVFDQGRAAIANEKRKRADSSPTPLKPKP